MFMGSVRGRLFFLQTGMIICIFDVDLLCGDPKNPH